MKAIILVAGVGKRLSGVTDAPKCLLRINRETLLERYFRALEKVNILDVVLVVGHKKEMILDFARSLNFLGSLKHIENPDFASGSILSLDKARNELDGDILLMDGDVYFETEVLSKLVNTNRGNLVAIDTTSSSSGEEMMVGTKHGRILDMRRNLVGDYDIVGEAVGFYKLNGQACKELGEILEEHMKRHEHGLGYEDILPSLFQRVHFAPVIVDDLMWTEIDFEGDIHRAEKLARSRYENSC